MRGTKVGSRFNAEQRKSKCLRIFGEQTRASQQSLGQFCPGYSEVPMPETEHEGSFIPIKTYNGKPGNYYCICAVCGGRFLGDKRDIVCPRPHPKSQEPEHRHWRVSHHAGMCAIWNDAPCDCAVSMLATEREERQRCWDAWQKADLEIDKLKPDALRWRYTQQTGYFQCGPFTTDGDWDGYSVGVQMAPNTPINKCVAGLGNTLQEAIDNAIQEPKQ